jgi:hypothetical protein
MEIQEALRIMRALADGVNRANGEALMADAVYPCSPCGAGLSPSGGCKTASVPKRRRPPMQANRGLEQKFNKFASSCAGELISTRSRRRTIEPSLRSSRAW